MDVVLLLISERGRTNLFLYYWFGKAINFKIKLCTNLFFYYWFDMAINFRIKLYALTSMLCMGNKIILSQRPSEDGSRFL